MIKQMKKVAKENCGACGDAKASNGKYAIVCFSMLNGSFVFNVYIDGKQVSMSESEIDSILINEDLTITGPHDSRALAA